jgi:histidine triad (HIT) family protein
MDCIFCKIINGEIPGYKLYEDEEIIAFLDAFPAGSGHTLVMPKAHYQDLSAVPEGLLQQIMGAAKRLVPAITQAVGAEGFNLFLNNGRAAGQLIDHLHLHILPRSSGDGLHIKLPQKPYPDGEAEKVQQGIVNALGDKQSE